MAAASGCYRLTVSLGISKYVELKKEKKPNKTEAKPAINWLNKLSFWKKCEKPGRNGAYDKEALNGCGLFAVYYVDMRIN